MTAADPRVAAIIDALDSLVLAIQASGVAATRNPEDLQPPAAIVAAPSMVGATLGALQVTVPVYFVVPDPGQSGIDQMLSMLAAALPSLGTSAADPTLWVGPVNPDGLPAYHVSVQLTVEGG